MGDCMTLMLGVLFRRYGDSIMMGWVRCDMASNDRSLLVLLITSVTFLDDMNSTVHSSAGHFGQIPEPFHNTRK